MSDALQHAPSFNEMVGLIEKLFKDYLQDIRPKMVTSEEIDKAWERYKTLNHLWQDEPQPGAVWVKANKFKYELEVVYHAKYDDNNKGAGYFNEEYEGGNHVFIWQDGADTFQNSFHRLLILDESGTAAGREEDAVKGKDMFTFIQWCFNEHPGMITKEHDEWYLSDSTFPELYELFKQKEK